MATILTFPNRSMERGRRAAAAVIAAGGSAMDAACAQIAAAFDEAAKIETRKGNIRKLIHFGSGHPAVRARYGARAAMLRGYPLEIAIVRVDMWLASERRAYQIASAYLQATSLSVDVLTELRIILRLIRADKVLRHHFTGIVDFSFDHRAEEYFAPVRDLIDIIAPGA